MLDALRTAQKWGARPSEFLGVGDIGRWSHVDRMLAAAFEAWEATRVGAFGFPKRLTEGDHEGDFEVVYRQDNAQLAWDVHQREAQKEREKPGPGMVPRVIFTG